ncbi:HET-domain-containing protein, partial [Xylariaceae sp. AK1471]
MYKNLDRSKHQIRLLRLLPSRGLDKVHCELFTASLDESNKFEALSYVWGSEKDLVEIVIGGEAKKVTRSLGSALHHLRNDEERILWVDAVCINQGDKDERSSQVQLMQRIYSDASQVVVWLGPLEEEDEHTIKAIERIGRDSRLHWTAIPRMHDVLFRLFFFLRHPWWTRIWTVQEAVLAKQMIYHRGEVHISSNDLIAMAKSYRAHVNTIGCCEALKLPDHGAASHRDVSTVTDNILQLRRFQLSVRKANFDEVAFLFRHRQATDPRDKVYGLLAISRGVKESSIDYHFSKAKVYELAARDSISHNNNLDILSHVLHGQIVHVGRSSDWLVRWPENTPSWVPDWTAEYDEAHIDIELIRYRASFLHHYNACGILTCKSTNGDADGKLHLSAVCCDTIETISNDFLFRPFMDEIDIIRDWRKTAGMEKDPGKAYVGGDTVSEAFWRTLCLDIHTRAGPSEDETRLIKRAGTEERNAYLTYWYLRLSGSRTARVSRRDVGSIERVHVFSDHVFQAIARRKFFISRKGYMGLAPLGVEPGDCICVFAGGRTPFIVRAVQQNPVQLTSRFVCRLLGDSYVHGLMDGEAIALVDKGELRVEDFEI